MLLYAVTDSAWVGELSLAQQVEMAIKSGATFVQLREKTLPFDEFVALAKEIKLITDQYNVPFVINDNVDVAIACDADGVHVGQSDAEVFYAREKLGADKIIGVSAQTVEQALKAQGNGADYIGVGAVFQTSTKLDADSVSHEVMKQISNAVTIPIVAIGGISKENILELTGTGIDGVAVVSAIFAQKDIATAVKELKQLVQSITLKYAIFDLDGTLIDSMSFWESVGEEYIKSKSKLPDPNIRTSLKELSLSDAAEYLRKEYHLEESTEFIIEEITAIISHAYKEQIQLKDGAMELLQSLKKHNIKMCIATATAKKLAVVAINRLNISDFFCDVITCTQVNAGKDKPTIFLKALEVLNADLDNTIIFEDALHAVKTAKSAGFKVACVYDESSKDDMSQLMLISDYYLKTLKEWSI